MLDSRSTRLLTLFVLSALVAACSDGAQPSADRDGGAGGSDADADTTTHEDSAPSPDASQDDAGVGDDTPLADAGGGATERFGSIGQGPDGLAHLFTIRTDGTDPQMLDTPGYYGIAEASWSGNGSRVAFTVYDETITGSFDNLQIMIADGDGSNLVPGPTGRTPTLNYAGDVLVFVDYEVGRADGAITSIQAGLRLLDLPTASTFDLGWSSGLELVGERPREAIYQLSVGRTYPPAVVAFVERSTVGSEGQPSRLEHLIVRLQGGSGAVIARDPVMLLGVNFEDIVYYVTVSGPEADPVRTLVAGTSRYDYPSTANGTYLFSPNSPRAVHQVDGGWWIGDPAGGEREPLQTGVPPRGFSSWFESPN
jgi:hypothetical protein